MKKSEIEIIFKSVKHFSNMESDRKINGIDSFIILKHVIETNDNLDIRLKALELMNNLEEKSQRFFQILENIILSDNSWRMRMLSIKFIIIKFPKACRNIINWAIKHETSPIVMKLIEDYSYGLDGHRLEYISDE